MNAKRLIFLLVLLMLSTSVHAQRFNKPKSHDNHRERTWEVTLLTQYQTSSNTDFERGSSLEIDSSVGWGIGVGWNWTQKLNLSWRFSLNKPDYTAIIVPEDPDVGISGVSYSMDRLSNQIDITYNFFQGHFTPFVQAGIGWTKLDSNIPDEPPQTGCWWDPWWGYICFDTWSTYKTSEFTYNLGVGLRWDINDGIFVRGTYNREFISVDNGNLDFDTLTLEGGLMW